MADELLMHFEPVITSLTLIPSHDGRFEVTADGSLVFSKAGLGRHARQDEVVELIRPLAEAEEQQTRKGL